MINRNNKFDEESRIERKNRRNYRKESQKQEKRIANRVDGNPTIGSGSFDFQKGDVICDSFLIEAKKTKKDFYIATHKTVKKIQKEAGNEERKEFALVFTLDTSNAIKNDWVIFPKSVYDVYFDDELKDFEVFNEKYRSYKLGIRIKAKYLNEIISKDKFKNNAVCIDFNTCDCVMMDFDVFVKKIINNNEKLR